MQASDPVFLAARDFLFGLAYRMLGTVVDAEDVVQDAWLRWQARGTQTIEDERAYLARITTHLAIDRLREQRRARANYVGPWLPEPLADAIAPADMALEHARSLAVGLLVLMDELTPHERAVFVLRHAFDFDFESIARCLDAKPATCRQWFKRARNRLGPRAETDAAPRADRGLTERLLAALAQGDERGVLALLGADVVVISDGGGRIAAASKPIIGVRAVSRFLLGAARHADATVSVELMSLNHGVSALVARAGQLESVLTCEARAHAIERIYIVRNPDKLARLAAHLARTPHTAPSRGHENHGALDRAQ
jgi:RNA polymerase sigma-70 factor (ECF subfamily)